MPDLMTHLATTHLLRRTWEYITGKEFTAQHAASLYVGGCLPDFISRMPGVVTGLFHTVGLITRDTFINCQYILESLHTPVPVAIAGYLLALLLPERGRSRNFMLLALASALHFLLDGLQTTLGVSSEAWLFPFSWASWHLDFFWPDQSILALPWLGGVIVTLELFCWRRRLPSEDNHKISARQSMKK